MAGIDPMNKGSQLCRSVIRPPAPIARSLAVGVCPLGNWSLFGVLEAVARGVLRVNAAPTSWSGSAPTAGNHPTLRSRMASGKGRRRCSSQHLGRLLRDRQRRMALRHTRHRMARKRERHSPRADASLVPSTPEDLVISEYGRTEAWEAGFRNEEEVRFAGTCSEWLIRRGPTIGIWG